MWNFIYKFKWINLIHPYYGLEIELEVEKIHFVYILSGKTRKEKKVYYYNI